MSSLGFLLEREAIVATALGGAALSVAGSLRVGRHMMGPSAAANLVRAGYGLTGLSMLLLIVAGFLSGR